MIHNKQLMLTAPKVPSGILPCSMQITEYDGISIIPNQMLIRVCKMENDPAATDKIQKVVVMYALKLLFVCISFPPTKPREVYPRLWPSTSTKTPHTMHSLISGLHPLRIDKDSSVREPRTSSK